MSVRELDHLVVHFGLIEVVVFTLVKRRVGRNALCTFDRVILTKVTFFQNTVDGQTTVAAKIVVVGVQDVIAAFLAVPLLNFLTPLFAAAMMVHLHKMIAAREPRLA